MSVCVCVGGGVLFFNRGKNEIIKNVHLWIIGIRSLVSLSPPRPAFRSRMDLAEAVALEAKRARLRGQA